MKRFPGVGKEKIPKRGSRERKLRDVLRKSVRLLEKGIPNCDVQQKNNPVTINVKLTSKESKVSGRGWGKSFLSEFQGNGNFRDVFTEKFSTAGKVSKVAMCNKICSVTLLRKEVLILDERHTSWTMRGCLSHSLSLHQLSTRSRSSPVRNAWLLLGLHHFAHSALEKEDHLCPPLFSRYHYCKTSGEKTM